VEYALDQIAQYDRAAAQTVMTALVLARLALHTAARWVVAEAR
jgi:hypothetical protein